MKKYLLSIVGILLLSSACMAGVSYPVIELGLREMILEAKKTGIVGSEWTTLRKGGAVAITIPSTWDGGFVFIVDFEKVPWLPEYKTPVLTYVGGDYAYVPSNDIGYATYRDGTKEFKEFYGSTFCEWQTIYFYAWTIENEEGEEEWCANFTWGYKAGPNEPGCTVDRTDRGTLQDEEQNLGFSVESISYMGGKASLLVRYDSLAEFTLETSSDLIKWDPVSYDFTLLLGTESWEGYVKFQEGVVEPIETYCPSHNFRLRAKNG